MNSAKLGLPILKIQVRYEPDIVTARQKTRRLAELLHFDSQDQARLATAVSELARNVFQYAGGGTIEYFFSETEPQTFFIRVSDSGPGISDLDSIFSGTYVSKTGMGVGLVGSKKLMDFFEIQSQPKKGTYIVIGKAFDKRSPKMGKEKIPAILDQLISRPSETAFEEIQNQNRELLNALDELQAKKEQLTELNRELSETNRGVVALYAELDEKAVSLQRANEVKTSFLSNMTHEFRTPLSSIISLTRILLQEIDGPLTEEQRKQVNYIRTSGESLLDLVSDLLDLAKVEAGKVKIFSSVFTIEELLGGLRGMFRPILGDSDVELNINWSDKIPELETDQAKLAQILRNLISNAVKYTEKGSINISVVQEQGNLHFKVTDSGIGIEPQYLETIFEDFSQLPSKLQKVQKGTGLGLPLSRKLARLLGGDVNVESQLGVGTTFHVIIPFKYSGRNEEVLIVSTKDKSENNNSEIRNHGDSKFRVLLIDDDEPSRYVLKDLIGSEIDAEFIEATNGKIGLNKIHTISPDLVFLDLSMPGLDGFEVISELKLQKKLADLPVVVNTAKKLTEHEMELLEGSVTAVLSKERKDHQTAVRALREALVKSGFDYKNK